MSAVLQEEPSPVIRYSLGVSRFDATPKQCQAADFQAFQTEVLSKRAAVKGYTYISAPFSNGQRSKESVELSRFIPMDFDGMPGEEAFIELRTWLIPYSAFAYTTSSHTPESPRARAILEASREMTREERIRVCMAVQARIERDIQGIKFDASVYRGEQPFFTPMFTSTDYFFEGEPIDVDAMLAEAPELKPEGASTAKNLAQISSTDPVLRELLARSMVKRDLGGGRFAVHCPCADEHSGPSESETATVYTLPKFNGFDMGNFTCLHDHCRDRSQKSFMQALELEHAEVRAKQTHIEVDHSALIQKKTEEKAQEKEERRARFRFLRADQLIKEQRVGWRVLDVIPKRGLVVMWGAPGSGKSFAAFDIGAAIARGNKYYEKRTKKGLVLIIAAEGDLTARTMAYLQEHRLQHGELDNLLIMQRSVNMLDPHQDMDDLLDTIQMVVDSTGEELALVIVDTLNRVMPGGNENASEDMGAVISNAKRIDEAFQCAVMFIHHSGKDETKGSRGHSSLKGAMDAEISIIRNEDIRTFRIEKQKEGRDYYDLYNFKLKTIDLGPMSDFDPDAEEHERLTSCVIEHTTEVPESRQPQTKNTGILQAALLASETGNREDVRLKYYELHTGTAEAKRKAFNRDWGKYMGELVNRKGGNE
jgi:hypothetical protein